jgi:hypothetical protein
VLAALLVAALAASSSCSPRSQDGPATPSTEAIATDGATISCANDPRAETYIPGLQAPGSTGKLTFILLSANPEPPALGLNAWAIGLRDATGASLSSSALTTVKPWMPEHGHGPALAPTVTPADGGINMVGSLDFFMPGLWQVTLEAQAGSLSDTGVFTFCVE